MTTSNRTSSVTKDAASALTEIAVVLDRSGSMHTLKDDMEGGLWSMIVEQHGNPGRCRVSLYQFDDIFEPVFEGLPSGDITRERCRLLPRGSTALHDGVVKGLSAIEARIQDEPETERPDLVIVVVITDGHNNASVENTAEDARKAISRATEKLGWKFAFLAADAAGFEDGASITRGTTGVVSTYDASNVKEMHVRYSHAFTNLRSGVAKEIDLTPPPIKADDSSEDPA